VADEDLLRRCQLRDPTALAELWDRYVLFVYRHIYYLLAGNRGATEALTMGAFKQAWETVQRLAPGRPVLPWLLEMAHQLAAQQLGGQETPSSGSSRSEGKAAKRSPLPILKRNGESSWEPLVRAVLALTPLQRQVLLLRFVDGMHESEVARAADKSLRSVRLAQYRALRRLVEAVGLPGQY